MKIALCCGDGLNYGKDWIGFDVVRTRFPGQLVLQDVRSLDGYRFRHAEGIFATPPCTELTLANPRWPNNRHPNPDLSVIEACFRIRDEAGVPFVLENVKGAQRWLGRSDAVRGPWHFWGDVGLLPTGGPWWKGKARDPRKRASVPAPLVPFTSGFPRRNETEGEK